MNNFILFFDPSIVSSIFLKYDLCVHANVFFMDQNFNVKYNC